MVSAIVFCSCQNGGEQNALESPLKIKEVITHNYTFKMVAGEPRKDSVKECFSCNLGLEFDEKGRKEPIPSGIYDLVCGDTRVRSM